MFDFGLCEIDEGQSQVIWVGPSLKVSARRKAPSKVGWSPGRAYLYGIAGKVAPSLLPTSHSQRKKISDLNKYSSDKFENSEQNPHAGIALKQ